MGAARLALGAVTLGALVAHAAGAPVPPPPRLTAEHLVGTWDLTWGERDGNSIAFYRDGTALEVYLDRRYVCRWWVDREGRLVLVERLVYDGGTMAAPHQYEFDVDVTRYPVVTARAGGTRLVLSR